MCLPLLLLILAALVCEGGAVLVDQGVGHLIQVLLKEANRFRATVAAQVTD